MKSPTGALRAEFLKNPVPWAWRVPPGAPYLAIWDDGHEEYYPSGSPTGAVHLAPARKLYMLEPRFKESCPTEVEASHHHAPMAVRRVETGGGSRIEPPCDDEWSEMDRLRWLAGVVKLETGIEVKVGNSRHFVNEVEVPGRFDFAWGYSVSGAGTFDRAWSFLSGFEQGAKAAKATGQAVAIENTLHYPVAEVGAAPRAFSAQVVADLGL